LGGKLGELPNKKRGFSRKSIERQDAQMGPTDPKISSVLGKGTTKGNGRKSASLISTLGLLEEQCVGPKMEGLQLGTYRES